MVMVMRNKGDKQNSPLLSSPSLERRESNNEYPTGRCHIDSSIEGSSSHDNEGSVEEHPYYNAIDIHEEAVVTAFLPDRNEAQAESRDETTEPLENAIDAPIVAVPAVGKPHNPLLIAAMLSIAAAYGSILGTFFLLTLPLECSRMSRDGSTKSVNLGIFIFVAGFTQLASPWIGVASDSINNPQRSSHCRKYHQHELGRRRPFLILGYVLCCLSLFGMKWCSISEFWVFYGVFYTVVMLALNVVYSALIALIPDLISPEQTGIANGIFAMLVVSGSLIGFLAFTYLLNTEGDLGDVYDFYNMFLLATTVLTVITACEESVARVDGRASSRREGEEDQLLNRAKGKTSALNGHAENGGEAERIAEAGLASPSSNKLNEKKPQSTYHLLCSRRLIMTLLTAVSVSATSLFSVSWHHVLHAYWLDPREHHDFFVVTISRGFYYMGVSSQTFLMYFLHDIIPNVNPQEGVALLSVIGFAAGACSSYPVGYLSDKLDKRRKPYVYASCFVLASGLISLLFCRTFQQVMIISAVVGCANGAYLAMDTSLAVDTLPDKSDAAKFLGIWGVAGFVGSALGPMLGGPLLYVFGTFVLGTNASVPDDEQVQLPDMPTLGDEDVQSYSIAGYAVIFCLSAVYFGCSAFSLRWVENSD